MTSHTELFANPQSECAAGNAVAGERLYRRLLNRVPNHVKALRALAELPRQQGTEEEAAGLAKTARTAWPDPDRVFYTRRTIGRLCIIEPNNGGSI